MRVERVSGLPDRLPSTVGSGTQPLRKPDVTESATRGGELSRADREMRQGNREAVAPPTLSAVNSSPYSGPPVAFATPSTHNVTADVVKFLEIPIVCQTVSDRATIQDGCRDPDCVQLQLPRRVHEHPASRHPRWCCHPKSMTSR